MEPNEFSKNYLLIAGPHNRVIPPIIGLDPPDIKNQIAVGMAVSAHIVNWTLIIFHVISKHYHVTVVVILLGVELMLTWLQVYPSVLGDDNPRLYIYATVST